MLLGKRGRGILHLNHIKHIRIIIIFQVGHLVFFGFKEILLLEKKEDEHKL